MFDLADIFTPDAVSDTIQSEISPTGIKPGRFCFIGKFINKYTVQQLFH